MKIKYDSGRDEFHIDRTDLATDDDDAAVPVAVSRIKSESDVPIALADHAHRHPDKWWGLDDLTDRIGSFGSSGVWRVGSKIPLNVYEGDRPVCQCHTVTDAKRIVNAMNRANW